MRKAGLSARTQKQGRRAAVGSLLCTNLKKKLDERAGTASRECEHGAGIVPSDGGQCSVSWQGLLATLEYAVARQGHQGRKERSPARRAQGRTVWRAGSQIGYAVCA